MTCRRPSATAACQSWQRTGYRYCPVEKEQKIGIRTQIVSSQIGNYALEVFHNDLVSRDMDLRPRRVTSALVLVEPIGGVGSTGRSKLCCAVDVDVVVVQVRKSRHRPSGCYDAVGQWVDP